MNLHGSGRRRKIPFMMMPRILHLAFISFFFVFTLFLSVAESEEKAKKKTFIFLVDPKLKPSAFVSHVHWYSSLLPISSQLLHHYHSLLHGFSASLTASEATSIGGRRGIVAITPDSVVRPLTTRSPSFLGLDRPVSRLSALSCGGSTVVIGFVDTGIWPERPSFSDHGLDPPPRRWQGECEESARFNTSSCNRKLVGARAFSAGYAAAFGSRANGELQSARDYDGHGTHVASIAAGAPVAGAGFDVFARGVARGIAPRARIAVYKVCWAAGCMVSDIVAAIEKAVSDGVDVLSLSIGATSPAPFYHLDPLAIATSRATMRGVFIAASAGNGGPVPGSVANSPPWITTVGAGTIDREFPSVVRLGNGAYVPGTSISTRPRRPIRRYPTPLLSAGKISAVRNLNSQRINGSIVFWESNRRVSRIEIGAALKRAGAVGMVVYHGEFDPEGILAEPHLIPTVAVGSRAAATIDAYIKTTRNPTLVIYSKGTVVLPGSAPVVASFSARGPNPAVPWVLKPDILAPGVDILGAWTGAIGPSGWRADNRRPEFSLMSGTSMACPHVSGVAALVRAVHPEWSPGEIRSALMTTATRSSVGDEAGEGGPLAMGAGHLCPERAMAPGLVYDLGLNDYIELLCGLNYTAKSIRIITGAKRAQCEASRSAAMGVWGFNYPGFAVTEEEAAMKGEVVFSRRMKRVDGSGAGRWYRAEVTAPKGYVVEVEPERMWFSGRDGEKVEFKLVIRYISDDEECKNINGGGSHGRRRRWWRGGRLRWWSEEEGKYTVTSPITILSFSSIINNVTQRR
ncbi:hypothetical protein Cni_G07006 [Canna indica]|uniref:Subtilisin-like protease SBT1.5 n=1 Tax=Canna indica TaxID=4628 RepID=A0AAQ3JY19_9LILI|nr:hypothetical protein Cni_G07006 [Canna indica]